MKVRMTHMLTGSLMYVEQDRVPEYLRAGHKLAPEPTAPKKPAPKARAKKTKE